VREKKILSIIFCIISSHNFTPAVQLLHILMFDVWSVITNVIHIDTNETDCFTPLGVPRHPTQNMFAGVPSNSNI
jgi:hypothetical protein